MASTSAVATPLPDAASSGTGIELTLRNLSLSVIPPPSLLTRVARKLRLTSNPDKSPEASTNTRTDLKDIDGDGAVPNDSSAIQTTAAAGGRTDRDLRNVGINIFRDVDLTVKPGQVCIILGGSGSGKTTLLNTIAGRMNGPEVSTSGSIKCNGLKAKKFWNDGSVGYLQQSDFLMPFLTVRETLNYAAHLRLPRTMSSQKKRELVELVLLELGLKECADTRVGDPGGGESGSGGIRGISGGERRRVSAGVQLLTNPKMLLCDEVTSGLDAFSSYEVMKSLTKLAQSSQKTIIISIHQPRSEIFKLLSESDGQMVLLSRGDVIYSGPVRSVLPWIESTGVGSCPTEANPFDYLLDLSMIDFASEALEKTTAVRRDLLVQAWAQRDQKSALANSKTELSMLTSSGGEPSSQPAKASNFVSLAVDIIPKGAGPSLLSQISVLTSRGWKNQVRDSLVIWGCVGECIVIGLAVGAIFYQLDGSLGGIRSRESLVYAVGAIQSYLMLMILIYRLSQEIVVYDRERMDRWYGPLPHLVSTVLFSAPPNTLYPVVFSAIVYYMSGLRTDSAQHFGWWLLVNVTMQFVTFTFAIMCSSLVRGFSSASLFGNAIFAFFGLSTGFFIVTSSIPVWLRWIKYLAYPNVCYNILASNEFTDNQFACPYVGADGTWDPIKCAPWDGNSILIGQLDIQPHHYPGPIVQMIYYFAGFLFVAWLALTINVVNPTSMGHGPTLMDVFISWAASIFSRKKPAPTSDTEASSTASSDVNMDIEKARLGETRLDVFSKGLEQKDPVTIKVEGLSLYVSLSGFDWSFSGILRGLRGQKTEKQLLKDVDVVFPAGELTAILGGSGAGKTSLLNTLLHRQPSSLNIKGAIYYNDTKNPSLRMINGVSSYVRQDDNFLLSHLTVRETLQYAAELRMDSSIPKADKYTKVEDIIDLLGLRECADVIVGNPAVKGISGGQRRRVSIGIQLVTEPACLFLDEPTSGLDALTAKAVVLTLKQIAASGRTVVCTIHQPRADIWHVFDNVVLLVTGGCAAYSGRADKVVEYFEDAGHVAPLFTNIPDFILDTASVNLRSIELEEKTRRIVNALVDRFNANKQTMLASQIPTQALGELDKVNPQFASIGKAFPILTRRSFVNTFRQKGLYFNRIAQPVLVAVIMTIFFAPLGNGPADVTSRFGLLQQTSPIVFAGMLNNVAMYPFERDIAYREISDGGYSATSFFFSFLVNEVPLEILGSLGVTVFMLVITHMKTTALTFFSFWLIMFGYINTGESIGMAFSTFASHAGFNITVMSAVISVFSFMTGFMSLNIPQWLSDINYVSLFKYGSVIMTRNEFEGQVFDCSAEQINSGACPYPTGDAVLELFKFQDKNWDLYMGLFVMVVVIYRLLAWLVLVAKVKGNRW
ncbi:P-loop containing nucleoside triphosphate hydrolase protein [Dissophora ornata]|nr:P-loop containing nucleoside triphosphate hydrolase protein [Dissophora ornata]